MSKTKAAELCEFGQSIWLDYISRPLLETGQLKALLSQGLRGMTSNPSIFEKAVGGGADYDEEIRKLRAQGKEIFEIYDDLTVKDIQDATDIFLPVYKESGKYDGYVSLEVNPELAADTKETVAEALRLAKKVDRPNVMFKIPATEEGFPAVEELTAAGLNINVTLIFSLEHYVKAAKAYLRGVRRYVDGGKDPRSIHSVASVFVSRIDTTCDKLLDGMLRHEKVAERVEQLTALKGKAAVANSAIIYKEYLELFSSDEFNALKANGANLQRVLWGSTSTKNPSYSDIKYVAELIAKSTVNTMPQDTLNAFLDHGAVIEALPGDIEAHEKVIDMLSEIGIDILEVCITLQKDGVQAFVKSFSSLLRSIEAKATTLCDTEANKEPAS